MAHEQEPLPTDPYEFIDRVFLTSDEDRLAALNENPDERQRSVSLDTNDDEIEDTTINEE